MTTSVTFTKPIELAFVAQLSIEAAATQFDTHVDRGLTGIEAAHRLSALGPNALRLHGARPWVVLARQIRNPLLVLLMLAAGLSLVTGDRTNAVIVFVIVALSVGFGFFNEYRSEQAVETLHDTIRHTATVTRNGRLTKIDVVDLVPGDIVHVGVGDIVPADLRLIDSQALECDEAVLTGESMPVAKTAVAGTDDCCALMGTVVRSGAATGIVARTGTSTDFGRIAAGLADRQPRTAFQIGLNDFSLLLVRVAGALCCAILAINVVLHHGLLDALLFALAIAIGITPQLLPAIVTVSLSTGARRLTKKRVLVKRLVAIEDLGNIEVLFTDKTGTLTEGHIAFTGGIAPNGQADDSLLNDGIVCNDAIVEDNRIVGGNALDVALYEAALSKGGAISLPYRRGSLPFDHDRQLASVLVDDGDAFRLITKGAPEAVLARCCEIPESAGAVVESLFGKGERVIAIATRRFNKGHNIEAGDETDLVLSGFLTFSDRPKAGAAFALERLDALGVQVKVITGDNPVVASRVCDELGLASGDVISGTELSEMSDDELRARIPTTRVFARVTPEQKSRVIRTQRQLGVDVAFLGDGVNDAVALHDADVGISVQGATEVATDAADIVLLDKDLGVLADGVVEGRRIFANTIKYVLMATSSNVGNMFSAAGASAFLSYLPMLPGQILLNNLLYDLSQTAIPTDHVDAEQLARPSAWNVAFIRRFMIVFGPISSVFDFITFWVMLRVLDAGVDEFRTGWFVESLATQTLVIFVIRTRRSPFWTSKASAPLTATTLTCVTVALVLPFSPLAGMLGFTSLPIKFLAILAVMVVTYLGLCETAKFFFYRNVRSAGRPVAIRSDHETRRVHRRAARFTVRRNAKVSKKRPRRVR